MTKLNRVGLIAFGYATAVLTAVTITVVALLLPTILPDNGAWGSFYRQDASGFFVLGLFVTFPTALPGFLFTLLRATHSRWQAWHLYAIAGAANVPASFVVFVAGMNVLAPHSYMRLADISVALFVACLPGGFAGGFAYWAAVGRFVAGQHGAKA